MFRIAPSFCLALLLGCFGIASSILLSGREATAQNASSEEQAAEPGFLTGQLEELLSAEGRQVRIEGFEGAFNSRSSIAKMTIADQKGIWLELENAELDWNRGALFSGRVEVNRLIAENILIHRKPLPAPSSLPSAEASGFKLPELPVSVAIGEMRVNQIVLNDTIIGEPVLLRVDGTASLISSEVKAQLAIDRLDEENSGFTLELNYEEEKSQLEIALALTAPKGGLTPRLLRIPGAPALELRAEGAGPLNAFELSVSLASNGEQRLSGGLILSPGSEEGARNFSAMLEGNLSPLLTEEFQGFFGDETVLDAVGHSAADGRLSLESFALRSAQLELSGALRLAPDGVPEQIAIVGQIEGNGERVRLPAAPDVEMSKAVLAVNYDSDQSDRWEAVLSAIDVLTHNGEMGRLFLSSDGSFDIRPEFLNFQGDIRYAALDIQPNDARLAEALGQKIAGEMLVSWRSGKPFIFAPVSIEGDSFSAEAVGTLLIEERDLTISARARATHRDLSDFSDLSGLGLAGSVNADLDIQGDLLGGRVNMRLDGEGDDLRIGISQADRLLSAGSARLAIAFERDENGTRLNQFELGNEAIRADLYGQLASGGTALEGSVSMPNSARSFGGEAGPLQLDFSARQSRESWAFEVDGTGNNIGIGQRFPDSLLRGTNTLRFRGGWQAAGLSSEEFLYSSDELEARLDGRIGQGSTSAALVLSIARTELLAPDYPGPTRLEGTLTNQPSNRIGINARLSAPAGANVDITGSLAGDGRTVSLDFDGSAPMGLANPFIEPRIVSGDAGFQLRMDGPVGLSSLSGVVTLADGRVSDPNLRQAVEAISGSARLEGTSLTLDLSGNVPAGGALTVNGPVEIRPPYEVGLDIGIADAFLSRPGLFETRATGNLALSGAIRGASRIDGSLRFGAIEGRISNNIQAALTDIPNIEFIGSDAAASQTRIRAGIEAAPRNPSALTQSAASREKQPRPVRMNIELIADNQIFLRGRGLDAEFGGRMLLGGTSNDIQPSGAFQLIRGRLNLLGKRLEFTEGDIQLYGNFNPQLRLLATASIEDGDAEILLEGPVSEPELSLSSTPEYDEDEILARIFFGQSIDQLSPFQLARLAASVATLSGAADGPANRIREQIGLDDLDVTTDDDGNAALRAGSYLSENAYADVQVDQEGKTDFTINLDITRDLTLRGTTSSDGSNGVGVFFEQDY